MNTRDIQDALDLQLQQVAGLPQLQLENTRLNASSNLTAFSRSTLLPAQSAVISIGPNAQKQMSGLYQVDIFAPSDTGTSTTRTYADLVVQQFPIGQRLLSNGLEVIIEVASVMPAYTINKYYCIPIRIQWTTYG